MPDSESRTVVDEDAFSVSRAVHIKAPRDRVWQAITDPEVIPRWFGDTAHLDELAVGAHGSFGWREYGDYDVQVTAVVDGTLVEYRWASEPGEAVRPDNSTLARFTLTDEADGTVLVLVETGFDALARDEAGRRELLRGNAEGWTLELDELTALLEQE